MRIPPIVIRMMVCEEREKVSRFVDAAMQKAYGCDAHVLPSFVLVALQSGMLVGSIALALDAAGKFPLEEIYAFDECDFPLGCARGNMVQFGRWVALKKEVSTALLYAAMMYALKLDFFWGLSEVKPAVARRFKQLGLHLHLLCPPPRAGLVPSSVLPYYLSPPPPAPCLLFLPHAEEIMRVRMGEVFRKGTVSICI